MPRGRPCGAVLLVTGVALLVTLWGSGLSVAAQSADEPECPGGLVCRFVPAAYAQTNPADPNAYGNYDRAERPNDGDDIRYIVIHDTEETYDSAIAKFQEAIAIIPTCATPRRWAASPGPDPTPRTHPPHPPTHRSLRIHAPRGRMDTQRRITCR